MKLYIYICMLSTLFAVDETIQIAATSFSDWNYFYFNNDGYLEEINISQPENSCDWDLGIMRNHFRTNSGASGNCDGGAYVDSSEVFTSNNWDNYLSIDDNVEFVEDGILDNIYDIITHTYSDAPGSNVLESWGWFDLVNNYQFMVNDFKFIIRTSDGNDAYKLWAQDYYNELGQSAHITLRYNTDVNFLGCSNIGDLNFDSAQNILDVVILVDCLLLGNCSELINSCAADINQDGNYNVLDIVTHIDCILNNSCVTRANDANMAYIKKTNSGIDLLSDGYIGAVYLELLHDDNFRLSITPLSNNLSKFLTNDNKTKVIIIKPTVESILSISGNYDIIDAHVANTTSLVDLKLLYTDTYTISNAYPNPFNPSTSFSITMNESEKVRVSVYNVLGKEINVIHNGPLDIGSHNFVWDANNLSSGVYYLRTISKTTSYSQKLVLIK